MRLRPLSQAELSQTSPHLLDRLFAQDPGVWKLPESGPGIVDRIISGGYPIAVEMPSGRPRRQWYREHIEGVIQRDVREHLRIRSPDTFRALLANAAEQTSGLWNVSKLCGPLDISLPTATRHVDLLERMFLLERLYPWRKSRAKQLLQTAKMHLCDTGIACTLAGINRERLVENRALYGAFLETFVFQELIRQSSGAEEDKFNFYRDKKQHEVDIVIERGPDQVVGIEVKAASTIDRSYFSGLRAMRNALGDRFKYGAVLYEGDYPDNCVDDRLVALPIRMLWEYPDALDIPARTHQENLI